MVMVINTDMENTTEVTMVIMVIMVMVTMVINMDTFITMVIARVGGILTGD